MTTEWVGSLSRGTYQLGLQNTRQQKLVLKGKCHQQVASIIPCTAVASKGAAADSSDDGGDDGIFLTVTVNVDEDLSAT